MERSGAALAGLGETLKQDQVLKEMAETPRMFDVMTLAYRDVPAEALASKELDSVEARRRELIVGLMLGLMLVLVLSPRNRYRVLAGRIASAFAALRLYPRKRNSYTQKLMSVLVKPGINHVVPSPFSQNFYPRYRWIPPGVTGG